MELAAKRFADTVALFPAGRLDHSTTDGFKRLRGLSQPQYRLRVGEVRVFYDVTREAVQVLAIVTKAEAAGWLAEHATSGAPGGAG